MTPAQRIAAATALATALAIPAEGLRQWAYLDPPGILTVCYGSTTDVQRGKLYSLDECKARLSDDMRNAITAVDTCAPGLPVNVLAAFADAAYNIGPSVACNTVKSTAARMLKAGDIQGACRQLPRWNRARIAGVSVPLPGLTARRAKEMALCLDDTRHRHYDLAMRAAKDRTLKKWYWDAVNNVWLGTDSRDWFERLQYALGDKPTKPPSAALEKDDL